MESSGERPPTDVGSCELGRLRDIGGGTASSSLSVSPPLVFSGSTGLSEWSEQKRKNLAAVSYVVVYEEEGKRETNDNSSRSFFWATA